MDHTSQAVTVSIIACHACGGGLFEDDRFCRLCGVRQDRTDNIPFEYNSDRESGLLVKNSNQSALNYVTSVLKEPRAAPYFRHSVSGPLISELVERMSISDSTGLCSRIARKTISILVTVPLWLIIILLSPLDAYSAARAVSNRAECEQGEGAVHRAGDFLRRAKSH